MAAQPSSLPRASGDEPTPPRIPIYIGGQADVALRRAARHDGWIGDLLTTDQVLSSIGRIRELRAESTRYDAADWPPTWPRCGTTSPTSRACG